MANSASLAERCADTTPTDWRNLRRLIACQFIWAVLFVLTSQALKRSWLPEGSYLWGVALVPAVASLLVIWAYVRFLSEADELQRVIHLRALSIGFGVTFFGIAAYEILERVGAPAFELGDVTLVMAIAYAAGIFFFHWRFR